MRRSSMLIRSVLGLAVIAVLIGAAPAVAGTDVIHQGVDLWMTVAGFAQTSFADEPIPAGFFCEGSQPFTGTVTFQGAPLAIAPAKSLGPIDTIVRRLDDAAFNEKGEATTRIQLMALSLVSTKPVETSCGKYDVAVRLDGEQPVTTMKIFRSEALGGTYSAPLSLNVKAVFTPVDGKGSRRELTRRVNLGPGSSSVWAYVTTPQYQDGIKVDTNGDAQPDTVLPASSNFVAGVSPAVLKGDPAAQPRLAATSTTPVPTCPRGQCLYQSCHCNPDATDPYTSGGGCDTSHLHCIWTCVTPTTGTRCLYSHDVPLDPAP
jgi:hypothetical protein